MRIFLALAATGFVLAGCAEPETSTMSGPGGNTIQTSRCTTSPEGCYTEAAKKCRSSYQVVDSYSKAGGTLADVTPGPVTWYYMTYQCGKSDGRLPSFPFRGPQYTPPKTTQCTQHGKTTSCYHY